jgi:glycosyltransferase involved in cell wall biosynthesis
MVVHAYYPLAETRVQRQAEALVAAGYAVDVLCLRGRGERPHAEHHGVRIHRLGVRLRRGGLARQFLGYVHFFVRATARLARLHARAPYGSVQVHNLPDFLVFCAVVPKLGRVPVILDLHDLMPEFWAGRFGGRRRALARLVAWQERAACRFADHVLTVSEGWRGALVARGVPAARCTVVMNVADERIFRPRPPRAPRRDAFRLVYHGTVVHRYGLDLALRAVAAVRDDVPGIHLTVLGTGDHLPELARMRRALGLERQVALCDRLVAAEELPAILGRADAGVVPYRDDVFTGALVPTKLMEYAALGLPCIAARTSAIEQYFAGTMVEFFTPGDAGDLAERIRRLAVDRGRLRELAAAGEHFTRVHNWSAERARYVALLERLTRPGTARAGSR